MKSIFNPINRTVYTYGLIFWLVAIFCAVYFLKIAGNSSDSLVLKHVAIVALLNFIFRIFWDFKRLKDMGGGRTQYYYFLVIPSLTFLINGVFALPNNFVSGIFWLYTAYLIVDKSFWSFFVYKKHISKK